MIVFVFALQNDIGRITTGQGFRSTVGSSA
jgi:hypothetical protein